MRLNSQSEIRKRWSSLQGRGEVLGKLDTLGKFPQEISRQNTDHNHIIIINTRILTSPSVLTAIFQVDLYRLAAGTRMSPFQISLELRVVDMVVTSAAVRRAKLKSNFYHQQTNTQFFLQANLASNSILKLPPQLPVTNLSVKY